VAIRDNKAIRTGGGVYVKPAGAFIMEGGVISGNSVAGPNGGGGVFVFGGTFTMKGGAIYGTDAEPPEFANTAVKGASVWASSGTAVWPAGTTGYVGGVLQAGPNIGTQELTVRAVTP
jgi:hypothetical protein